MVLVTLDLRDHNAAVLAQLETTLGTFPAYGYGQVPGTTGTTSGTTPATYLLFAVERVYDVPTLLSGEASEQEFRIITRPVARTLNNMRLVGARVSEALNERLMTVAGRDCFVRFENSSGESFDSPHYESTSLWTYTF